MSVLVLSVGLACAAMGGELLVRGAVGVAEAVRIPAGIIGATVAAFATSSPEMSVAIGAALEGRPQLALGDALGSNVVNIGLALGLVLLVGPVSVGGGTVRRDLGVALVLPILTAVLSWDGFLGRADALALLVVFFYWLVTTAVAARRERSAATAILAEHSWPRAIAGLILGLLLLVAAGRFVVDGAKGIGDDLGLDPFVVGVLFVAVGTSVPEIATALVARLRGYGDVGLGTILGSNVFNGGLVVPLVALIRPFRVDWSAIAVTLMFGIVLVVSVLPFPRPILGRARGALLLSLYSGCIVTLLATQS